MPSLHSSGKPETTGLVCLALWLAAITALTSSAATGATIWDVNTGQRLTNSPFAGGIRIAAAFSPNGALLVTSGNAKGPYRIWYVGPAGSHPGEWTIRIGQGHYGFAHLKGIGAWPRANFLIWNNLAYRIQPALLAAVLALITILVLAAIGFIFRRKSESAKN